MDTELATKKDLEAFATKKDLEDAFTVLSDNIRAVGVMVERVQSDVRLLAEGLTSTREQLERRIDALDTRLSDRMSVLEEVVRQNSAGIRKNSEDIQKNSDDIRLLKKEVADMRGQLARLERFDLLDARITTIEKRLASE